MNYDVIIASIFRFPRHFVTDIITGSILNVNADSSILKVVNVYTTNQPITFYRLIKL